MFSRTSCSQTNNYFSLAYLHCVPESWEKVKVDFCRYWKFEGIKFSGVTVSFAGHCFRPAVSGEGASSHLTWEYLVLRYVEISQTDSLSTEAVSPNHLPSHNLVVMAVPLIYPFLLLFVSQISVC